MTFDMEMVNRFLTGLRPEDMRWFLPLAVGALIGIVALLIAIFRGFTFANFLALALGCALAGSSVIGKLAFGRDSLVVETVAKATARLTAATEAQARALGDLRLAVGSLDQAVSELAPPRPDGAPAASETDPAERARRAQAAARDALASVDKAAREAADLRRQAEAEVKSLEAFAAGPGR